MMIEQPNIDIAIKVVAAIQKPLDQAFELIAERLPQIGQELDGLVAALDSLESDETEQSLENALHVTRLLATQLRSLVDDEVQRNRPLLSLGTSLVQGLESMAPALSRIDSLAKGLRITGLNASIIASQSGEAGRVFVALSRELVALTKGSLAEASRIRQIASLAREATHDILRLQKAMEEEIGRTTEQAQRAADDTSGMVSRMLERHRGALTESRRKLSETVQPIRALMIAIQEQDIVRQSLNHVAMVLAEVQTAFGAVGSREASQEQTLEYLAFQADGGELCVNLANDVAQKVSALFGKVSTQIAALGSAARALTLTVEQVYPEGGARQAARRLTQPLEELHRMAACLKQGENAQEKYNSAVQAIGSCARQVHGAMRRLSLIADELRNLRILLNLEIDRSSSMARARSLLGEIASARESFLGCLGTVGPMVQMLDASTRNIDEIVVASQARRTEQVESFVGALPDHVRRAEQALACLLDGLAATSALGESVAKTGEDFETGLSGARASLSGLSDLARKCRDIAESARAQQQKAGGSNRGSAAPGSKRLQELADRFTVLAHKEIAGSVGHWQIESGDSAGTLTLF